MSTRPSDPPDPARTVPEDEPSIPSAPAARLDPPVVQADTYEILGEQGRGGLGLVLRARDRRLDRTVAVKVLIDGNDRATQRFEREARLTARLQHPSIVPVHESGRWSNGVPFYAMKLVSGRTLRAVMADRATLAERLALLPNLVAVAEAIAYAHSEDVIHRDLKPSNVLVGGFGETVVVDWGLAKDLRVDEPGDTPPGGIYRANAAEGLTVAGTVVGTPSYMPPEQARGEVVDKRADVYALGAMLYELLAGAPPYGGSQSDVVIAKVLAAAPPPIADAAPGAPTELTAIVDKAMARAPGDRYPDGKALADDLTRFQTGQLVSAHRYGRGRLVARWMRRHRLAVTATAVALVVAAGIGGLSIRRILRERAAAEAARNTAVAERQQADVARADAEQQRNDLILVQAKSSFLTDPTATIDWLRKYPLAETNWRPAAEIATDADSRGVASLIAPGESAVTGMASSADGRWLVVHRAEHAVEMLDLQAGRVVFAAPQPATGFFAVAPGDTHVLYAPARGQVALLELGAPAARAIDVAGAAIDVAAFVGDGTHLIAHAENGAVYLCSGTPATCEPARFDVPGALLELKVAHDGRLAIFTTPDGRSRIFDLVGRKELTTGAGRDATSYKAFIERSNDLLEWDAAGRLWLHPDGAGPRRPLRPAEAAPATDVAASATRELVVGDATGGVEVVDAGGQVKSSFRCGTDAIVAVAISADGAQVAAGTVASRLCTWHRPSGASSTLLGHTGAVSALELSADGRRLVSSDQQGEVRVWALPAPPVWRDAAPSPLLTAAWSPTAAMLAYGGHTGLLRLVDLSGTPRVIELPGHRDTVRDLDFSPDGRQLITASWDRDARLWDVATGASRVLAGHQDQLNGARFLAGGTRALTTGSDGQVRLWDVATATSTVLLDEDQPIGGIAITPARTLAAVGGAAGQASLLAAPDYHVTPIGERGAPIAELALSPDGRWLAVTREDRRLELFAVAGGKPVQLELDEVGYRLAFTPDSRALVVGGQAGAVLVVDVATAAVRVLGHHEDAAKTFLFTADGRLVTGSLDGTVRVWDLSGASAVAIRRFGPAAVMVVAPSADGRLFLSAALDGEVAVRSIDALPNPWRTLRDFQQWLDLTGKLAKNSHPKR